MSPAVVATWITEQRGDDPVQLRIVILWRGTPGWFLRAGGSSVSGSSSASGDRQGSHHTIIQGGIRLTFDFDTATSVAIVQGKTLDLREDNVVLVDDVDSPNGPRVSGTIARDAVDAGFSRADWGSPEDIAGNHVVSALRRRRTGRPTEVARGTPVPAESRRGQVADTTAAPFSGALDLLDSAD